MNTFLAGCFPNCTPDPSSGFSTAGGGTTGLGAAVIVIVIVILVKLLTGKSK